MKKPNPLKIVTYRDSGCLGCLLLLTILVAFSALALLDELGLISAAVGGEREEVTRIAEREGWQEEVVQWDRSRVDLLTPTHAIEVDWAYKWSEAIGQSLYYAALTGKQPGIILLTTNRHEEARFIYRCQTVCARHGIWLQVETVGPDT